MDLFKAMKSMFSQSEDVEFAGSYTAERDKEMSDKDIANALMNQVYEVTGYRFTSVLFGLITVKLTDLACVQVSRMGTTVSWMSQESRLLPGHLLEEGEQKVDGAEREAARHVGNGSLWLWWLSGHQG
jgi:hypothetical protein